MRIGRHKIANHFADRTHCANNHEFTPENTGWRKDGGRVCKECKRQREAKRRLDPLKRAWIRDRDRLQKRKLRALQRGEDELVHKNDAKKTAAWNLNGIKPDAQPYWEHMNDVFDQQRTPCFDKPELFSDYDDPRPDYQEDNPGIPMPSTGQAESLCNGCPLLQDGSCLAYALAQRESAGVWGGKRIVDGRVYTGGSGRNGA